MSTGIELQKELNEWQRKNFGLQPVEFLALGVGEEVGELSHALLKRYQGIRGFDNDEKFIAAVADAVADIAIYSMQICSALGIDYYATLERVAREVMMRDWTKNSEDGDGV
jgi:NTP pyrophosphatase (non-canonical NTP hydrolase)